MMRRFINYSIPPVAFRPWGANAHSPDKHVDLDSILEWTAVMRKAIWGWCKEDAKP